MEFTFRIWISLRNERKNFILGFGHWFGSCSFPTCISWADPNPKSNYDFQSASNLNWNQVLISSPCKIQFSCCRQRQYHQKVEQKSLFASEMTLVALLEVDNGQKSVPVYLNPLANSSYSIIPLRYVRFFFSMHKDINVIVFTEFFKNYEILLSSLWKYFVKAS